MSVVYYGYFQQHLVVTMAHQTKTYRWDPSYCLGRFLADHVDHATPHQLHAQRLTMRGCLETSVRLQLPRRQMLVLYGQVLQQLGERLPSPRDAQTPKDLDSYKADNGLVQIKVSWERRCSSNRETLYVNAVQGHLIKIERDLEHYLETTSNPVQLPFDRGTICAAYCNVGWYFCNDVWGLFDVLEADPERLRLNILLP